MKVKHKLESFCTSNNQQMYCYMTYIFFILIFFVFSAIELRVKLVKITKKVKLKLTVNILLKKVSGKVKKDKVYQNTLGT